MYCVTLFIFALNILSAFSQSSDCQRIESFFNEYKKKTGSNIIVPECCEKKDEYHNILCNDKGFVTEIQLRYNYEGEHIDFSTFPILDDVKKIILEGLMFNNNVFPSRFLSFPKLESLMVMSAKVEVIPEISSSCSLTELSIFNNTIRGFPTPILNCKNLTNLDISVNKGIGSIPDSITTLKDLKYFYLGITGLKTLSPKVFELEHLIDFDIDGNTELTVEVDFKKNTVENCDLRNINVACYAKGSCKNFIIQEDPRVTEPEELNKYNSCIDNSSANSNILIAIICGIIILIIIIILVLCYIMKKKKKTKKTFRVIRQPSSREEIGLTKVNNNMDSKSAQSVGINNDNNNKNSNLEIPNENNNADCSEAQNKSTIPPTNNLERSTLSLDNQPNNTSSLPVITVTNQEQNENDVTEAKLPSSINDNINNNGGNSVIIPSQAQISSITLPSFLNTPNTDNSQMSTLTPSNYVTSSPLESNMEMGFGVSPFSNYSIDSSNHQESLGDNTDNDDNISNPDPITTSVSEKELLKEDVSKKPSTSELPPYTLINDKSFVKPTNVQDQSMSSIQSPSLNTSHYSMQSLPTSSFVNPNSLYFANAMNMYPMNMNSMNTMNNMTAMNSMNTMNNMTAMNTMNTMNNMTAMNTMNTMNIMNTMNMNAMNAMNMNAINAKNMNTLNAVNMNALNSMNMNKMGNTMALNNMVGNQLAGNGYNIAPIMIANTNYVNLMNNSTLQSMLPYSTFTNYSSSQLAYSNIIAAYTLNTNSNSSNDVTNDGNSTINENSTSTNENISTKDNDTTNENPTSNNVEKS